MFVFDKADSHNVHAVQKPLGQFVYKRDTLNKIDENSFSFTEFCIQVTNACSLVIRSGLQCVTKTVISRLFHVRKPRVGTLPPFVQ